MTDDEKLLQAKARLMTLLLRKGARQTDLERMVYQALRRDHQIEAAFATEQRARRDGN